MTRSRAGARPERALKARGPGFAGWIARAFGLALVGALGCGDADLPEAPDAGCPSDLPASCPASAPTSWSEVEAIVLARCAPCHSTGSTASTRPLVTYDDVFARRGPALNQLYACKMPPASAEQPSSDERAALLGWFVCGAPKGAP